MALLRAVCNYKTDRFAAHIKPFLLFILIMDKCQLDKFDKVQNKRTVKRDHVIGDRVERYETLLEASLSEA
jgi:hypothetical protein